MKMPGAGLAHDAEARIVSAIALENERAHAALMAGYRTTQRGLLVEGADYRPLPAASGQLYNGSARIVGWAMRAVGGTATVELRNGRTVDGDLVAAVDLVSGGSSVPVWMGPGGVSCPEGLFVVITLGTATAVSGTVWLGAVD